MTSQAAVVWMCRVRVDKWAGTRGTKISFSSSLVFLQLSKKPLEFLKAFVVACPHTEIDAHLDNILHLPDLLKRLSNLQKSENNLILHKLASTSLCLFCWGIIINVYCDDSDVFVPSKLSWKLETSVLFSPMPDVKDKYDFFENYFLTLMDLDVEQGAFTRVLASKRRQMNQQERLLWCGARSMFAPQRRPHKWERGLLQRWQ